MAADVPVWDRTGEDGEETSRDASVLLFTRSRVYPRCSPYRDSYCYSSVAAVGDSWAYRRVRSAFIGEYPADYTEAKRRGKQRVVLFVDSRGVWRGFYPRFFL